MLQSAAARKTRPQTLAEVLHRLGDIPPERIRWQPFPGTATEADVVAALDGEPKHLCELVEGVLVEKTMGADESFLAGRLIYYLWAFLEKNDLGIVLGADGALRLMPGLIRIPDVSFISWKRLPQERLPDNPIPHLAPDLAVEVLSKSNPKAEISRKVQDYFRTGVRLAWIVEPRKEYVDVYRSPKDPTRLAKDQTLDGGEVLPGFRLAIKTLLAPRTRRPKKK